MTMTSVRRAFGLAVAACAAAALPGICVGEGPATRPAAMARLWQELATEDLAKASRASVALARGGDEAAKFLSRCLKAKPVDPARTRRLVAELDSPRYPVREKAQAGLAALGLAALPALRTAQKAGLSAEAGSRIKVLLARESVLRLRRKRALAVLDMIKKKTDPVAEAKKTLLAPDARANYGLRVRANDRRLLAIRKLTAIGSADPVAVLLEFLTTYYASRHLKIHALAALGQIGTVEAARAAETFEDWADRRRSRPAPFRFGNHDYAIDHFAPLNLAPAAEHADGKGGRKAVFRWRRYGANRLWLTERTGKGPWGEPILLPIPAGTRKSKISLKVAGRKHVVVIDGKAHSFTLDEVLADADKDGLPDGVEQVLGTDPKRADSDGDGTPDDKDPCPLTAKRKKADDDVAQIRQAAFAALFATCGSRDAVVIVPGGGRNAKFADQEYRGYAGPVLKSPKIRRGFVNLTGLDVVLTSKTTAVVRIRDYEGNLASSTHKAHLRKLHGRWTVVSLRLTMIS